MTVVTDAIAAELATLSQEILPPGPPLAYGVDLSCVTDATDAFDELDPDSPLGIAQMVIRTLTAPRGSLPDDLNRCTDIHAWLNRGVEQRQLQSYESQARGECRKDDRVSDATVTITLLTYNTARIAIQLQPADPTAQDFELVFTVDDQQALLESIR